MTTEPFTSRPIVSREPGVVIRRPVLDKRRFAQPRPAWEVPDPYRLTIELVITRDGADVWTGSASTAGLHRKFGELVDYLYRADVFPDGVVLATGTSLVPELPFSLADGDVVTIRIGNVGTLVNPVIRGRPRPPA